MKRRQQSQGSNTAKILAGLFVIFFGFVFLAYQYGIDIPNGLLSWKSFLIAAGIVSLVRHNFRHFIGYAMIAIGTAFLIDDYFPKLIDTKLVLPILVILFGVVLIGKATDLFSLKKKQPRKRIVFDEDKGMTEEDFIEATAIFGSVKRNVTSKNFQGADISTVFGGTEINLTKAEIQGPITINSRTAFGGVTLIVPSHWQVRSDVTAIFGAVEDQRGVAGDNELDDAKIITLEGTCIFGGVEIQSYV